ncbi:MAG: transposase, partial [Oscillospiraceae bacterium]|nr:transposase [Oscillospiraceae bacterium]
MKDELPKSERDPNREYKRRPGGGRKPPDMRKILAGIFYVLRTGIQWKAVPREYGGSSNIHRWFQILVEDGFFVRIWAKGLEQYDEIVGIDWEWQSV